MAVVLICGIAFFAYSTTSRLLLKSYEGQLTDVGRDVLKQETMFYAHHFRSLVTAGMAVVPAGLRGTARGNGDHELL